MARTPKYRRHSVRDLAFVEYEGKRTYLPGAYKSPESMAAYAAFIRSISSSHIESAATLGQLIVRFTAWSQIHYPPGPRSEHANVRAALQALLEFDGDSPLATYEPTRLKKFQEWLAQKNLSRNYCNSVVGRVKRMFKWGASEGLVKPAIYHALAAVSGIRKGRTAARETPPRQPVAWADVEAVLHELSPMVAAMVMLQWHTGARSRSICLARPEQFDCTKTPWEWRPRHKMENQSELVVYIGPQARAILAPLLESADGYLFQPKHLSGRRARGYRAFYDSTSYLRAITRAIDRVNRKRRELDQEAPQMPHWTPHQLRHSRGTLVRAEHGLEAAQAILGHSRLSTAEIYAQKRMALARTVAEQTG
jgi:integrase